MGDIGEKREALGDATNDYCKQYSEKENDDKFECSSNGWPDDGDMPKSSIILGFYVDSAKQWDEPTNLYTGDRSCRSGDDAHMAFKIKNPDDPSQNVSVNMCLVKDYGTKDPYHYFGGMYSNKTNNYFTKKKSCPDGFADYVFMGCDDEFSDLCIEPHICYNATKSLNDSIIGGFYTEATNVPNGKDQCQANNPYTNKQSCPNNFEPYTLATTYWGNHPGYYCTMKVCFSNNAIH